MEKANHVACQPTDSWIVYDAIHGRVSYPSYVRQVVDTAEFQRLRGLKQVGPSSRVFPCATHTRFEHCLGVCFLARRLLETLEKNSGVLISDIHRKCVTLAALLHDVGHGPFSHMWEDFVHLGEDKDWTHEQTSCDMARHLFAANDIQLSQESYEHFYAEQLICALITGNQKALKTLLTPDTMFLSEIVHNKQYKIDVDKWDYLLRDLYYFNGVVQIDKAFVQLFDYARVVHDKTNVSHIAYRATDYRWIVELFEARTKLHIECYQNLTVLGIEKLLIDAFRLAEESGFRLKGDKISQVHRSPEIFLYLDDSIISLIENSDNPKLKEAQHLLVRLRRRQVYTRIHVSNETCDIEHLNERFGEDLFFQVHKRIPYASEMAPRDVPLYDERGQLIDNQPVVASIMNSLSNHGFYEQYIVYCKTTSKDIINSARQYLQRLPTVSIIERDCS
ncbi:deoxynucleoside triphosphate triphosphohydrolase SAMHD1 [Malaya genurostris]|uniref:deoxynucleoside triphosphate triphosphohydrolase SAMHD1 n=1 Tax=Malaya genurostris TaxID=325434 RepID=UPI0026F3EC06|nr:deoxynucleoside triphosphate triphosphohydrolase SAMHD1 [Malaya genurostris]